MYPQDALDRPADPDTIPPMARKYPVPPSGALSGDSDFEFIESGRGRLMYSPQWDEEHQPEGSLQAWRLNACNDDDPKGGA